MQVRSRATLVLSLGLLFGATGLGAVLAHDGELGTDQARLPYADDGDAVKVKGTLEAFTVPSSRAWSPYVDMLHHDTYLLDVPGIEADVLVTGLAEDMDAEAVVVDGDVLWNGPHPDDATTKLLILDAAHVTSPFFTW